MPKPRKPMALRELHGTANRNKYRTNQNEPVVERGIGEPSEHLNKQEKAIWDEVVSQMYAGVLGSADRLALEMICRLVHEMRTNLDMKATKLNLLVSLLGRFGMTPSDRAKIVVPKKTGNNPFENFRR